MSVTPQQLSRMTSERNLAAIDEHLAREDRNEARDEAIQVMADGIWKREVADRLNIQRIAPEKVREALFTIADSANEVELRELAELVGSDQAELGRVMADWIREVLEADCTEKARERLNKLERAARDDAAAGRMGY